jgi:LAGLIDADG DNA endonuclease family
MDDGTYTGAGIKLYTNAYTLEEVKLLITALKKNFNINSTIHNDNIEKKQYSIYKSQIPLVKSLVKNYIILEMKYKLGKD